MYAMITPSYEGGCYGTYSRSLQEQTIEDVDLVVLAYGGQAADARSQAVRERVGEVYVIGDALAPRRLMDAILDGARLGRRL
jgi:2,4-dienoyl-CoA reductase (NADPH2)